MPFDTYTYAKTKKNIGIFYLSCTCGENRVLTASVRCLLQRANSCTQENLVPPAIAPAFYCLRLLKEGGVWINFGPLLFHWSDSSLRETDERFQREFEFAGLPQVSLCSG